jgi:hypothetical protein
VPRLLLLLAALLLTSPALAADEPAPQAPLKITALETRARHTHGGPPAPLGHARFELTNEGSTPVAVRPTAALFVRTIKDCDEPPSEPVERLVPAGLFPEDDRWTESRPALVVEPGETVRVIVGWPAVDAYYVYCDRFGFRVTFELEVAGAIVEARTVLAEIQVIRVEPLRDPP